MYFCPFRSAEIHWELNQKGKARCRIIGLVPSKYSCYQ